MKNKLFSVIAGLLISVQSFATEVGKTYWWNPDKPLWGVEYRLGNWIKVIDESSDGVTFQDSQGQESTMLRDVWDYYMANNVFLDYDPIEKRKQEEQRQQATQQAVAEAAAANAKAARDRAINEKPWPESIKQIVRENRVQLGMTSEQVTMSWGRPNNIDRSVGAWGTRERWVYGRIYLFFQNDKLTSWQDSRQSR